MKIALALAALLLGATTPAFASATITAGEFLARAEPLMKKSKAALIFSGEARRLVRILGDTASRNRARIDADRAAGKPVAACLPPKGKASVDSAELIRYLRALPPAQKTQSFDAAFAGFMTKKYPCRS